MKNESCITHLLPVRTASAGRAVFRLRCTHKYFYMIVAGSLGTYNNNLLTSEGGDGQRDGIFSDAGLGAVDAASGTVLILSKTAQNPISRVADVLDGTSNTFFMFEKTGRPNLWIAGVMQQFGQASANQTAVYNTAGNGAGAMTTLYSDFPGWASATNDEWVDGQLPGLTTKDSSGGPCVVNCSNSQGSGIYAFHSGGGHALVADGTVRFISSNVDSGAFSAACTKKDAEKVNLPF